MNVNKSVSVLLLICLPAISCHHKHGKMTWLLFFAGQQIQDLDNQSGTAITPTFTPGPGSYPSGQNITINSLTTGATIRCTQNGSPPTTLSNDCTDPITLTAAITLKAIATKSGLKNSSIATGDFSICGDAIISPQETCDDGNSANGDGCSKACKGEAGFVCMGTPSVCYGMCGDGMIVAGEGCDDGNAVNGDGCSTVCMVEPGYTCLGTPSVCTN